MSDSTAIDWDELLGLHVVKKVAKLAARRWNLGLGYVDALTGQLAPPLLGDAGRFRGPCQVLQDSIEGRSACSEHAKRILEGFVADAQASTLHPRPISTQCHAGLTEIAAPIIVNGRLIGGILCGGFLPEEEAEESKSLNAIAPHHPHLSRREVPFVGDLIEEAAAEIAAFLISSGKLRSQQSDEGARRYQDIIGEAPAMQSLYSLLDRVVGSDSTVLITGENGTGKELVAKAIHYNSPRSDERFVVQNCSAFNDNLLDSELFGHKRGAFTGAVNDKKGLFEVAHKGTFFLDEIGDMSPVLQVKVLRVLQEGTFTPVGSTDTRHVNVRIVAATNRNLQAMVAKGTFREDLYYRINVIDLHLPSLRERIEDINLLAAHFLEKHNGDGKRLSPACVRLMREYHWPGNVRELENEIERLVVLSGTSQVLAAELLSSRMRHALETIVAEEEVPESSSLPEAVRALERRMIREALAKHDWNKTRTAAYLQVSRRNLIRLVQKYDLDRSRPLPAEIGQS